MRFAIFAQDKPDSLELRMETRAEHLAYLSNYELLVAGPLLDDDGAMCGSLIIMEAESSEEIERIAEGDPYRKAGLFESVTIRAINTTVWPGT